MRADRILNRERKEKLPAPVLMVAATFLFATMGMCVKFASAEYSTSEIVFYRGLVGAAIMLVLTRTHGLTLRTSLPSLHFSRSITGVSALGLWFYAIGELPLSTAVTLNYMSPIWMALMLLGGSAFLGGRGVDVRLACTVLLGFAGVVCILQPTMEHNQLWAGLMGLLSGLLTAMAYLQVSALGKAGEPEGRVVFYFSLCSIGAGALVTSLVSGWHVHTLKGLSMLLAVGLLATLAQLLMTRAYAIGRMLVNGSLQYLSILWSYFYGVLLFNDLVTGLGLLGMGLIAVAGIAAARLRQSITPANSINTAPGP
ncbi:DMT family transporter [Nitrosospira briensis]|uniref:S-adenosylmethionine uptake transporter n=2 Tax=Nitrosospira briensis TaxID=35799 RepID=A0A1I4Y3B5_9PROT|nr:DMT family transporter [Nitrosospira briensis]SFN32010.1 S-adenosylmethionine uptake transporter [Nitrosospira briensis]SFN68615.1 S-adenosylmethionine uptake transporter [Nitrosospira briensis]